MSDNPVTAKKFNTAGPCSPLRHYMLPALPRLPEIGKLISEGYYFIFHSPRQSGKTTLLMSLVNAINAEGQRHALYCSLESLQDVPDVDRAIDAICRQITTALSNSEVAAFSEFVASSQPTVETGFDNKILEMLTRLSKSLDKSLVVFFDEVDCLASEPLIPFLRQIRVGYNTMVLTEDVSKVPSFPRSMALVGMRNIRDYLLQARGDSESLHLASPFNITKKTLLLGNFSLDEMRSLYGQHSDATRQCFEESAVARAWHWSEGQPWLVNALAYEAVSEILQDDNSTPVTGQIIDQAAQNIIKRRDVHIDSLLERLAEPRVAKVLDSVFASTISDVFGDDRQYCIDLGLVVPDEYDLLRPTNAIYKEVINGVITDQLQKRFRKIIPETSWSDGKIIFVNKLLSDFQQFWRQGALSFPKHNRNFIAYNYDEAFHCFILAAYLQRIINSGATVTRELAEGRGSVDIGIKFNAKEYIIEVKIKGNDTLSDSLQQLSQYLDANGEKEGWLVIFDRDRDVSWQEKIYKHTTTINDKIIHIFGC